MGEGRRAEAGVGGRRLGRRRRYFVRSSSAPASAAVRARGGRRRGNDVGPSAAAMTGGGGGRGRRNVGRPAVAAARGENGEGRGHAAAESARLHMMHLLRFQVDLVLVIDTPICGDGMARHMADPMVQLLT